MYSFSLHSDSDLVTPMNENGQQKRSRFDFGLEKNSPVDWGETQGTTVGDWGNLVEGVHG